MDHRVEERRARARSLVEVALEAIEPRRATQRALQKLKGQLSLEGCTIFAFGKAARGMAEGALEELTPQGGVVH